MNWLLITVIAVLLLSFLHGMRRGLLRQGLSLFGAVICLWLITFIQPYAKDVILEHTSVESRISDKVDQMIASGVSKETEEAKSAIADQYGIDPDQAEELAEDKGIEIPQIDTSALSKSQQTELIRKAPLPKFLRERLIENNNNEIYDRLGVDNMVDYVKAYLTGFVVSILAYVSSFLITFVLYRIILAMARIVDHLPLARGLNRALGGMFGLGMAVVILGLFFALLIPLCDTQMGRECFKCIESSALLEYLYQHNPIMAIITAIAG